ncbi:MAG TPA: CDP-diacylglycerol--serine O-phosphatidyltransferase, partial [Myxococcaceae bacterium]|nr:CDP-diacylglycerol--serine O-phosphatidyltransferase [Myxococcaceae bacterium]
KVKYFEGTPIPTSLALVAVLAVATWQGRIGPGEQLLGGVWQVGSVSLHPLVLLYLVSGSAMISKTLRIPKF